MITGNVCLSVRLRIRLSSIHLSKIQLNKNIGRSKKPFASCYQGCYPLVVLTLHTGASLWHLSRLSGLILGELLVS